MEITNSSIYLVGITGILAVVVFFLLSGKPFVSGLISEIMHGMYRFARSSSQINWFSSLSGARKRVVNPDLPHVDTVEKVSNRVYRILGQNPGAHTLQGTNIYLVTGTKSSDHVMIDTGEGWSSPAFLKVLIDDVFPQTNTKRLKAIILTHGHHDHQGGVLPLLEMLRDNNMLPLPMIYKRKLDTESYPAKGFECLHIEDNQVFAIDDSTSLQAVYTPGHTDDHVSFILREDGAIFTGDCVLGCGTTVFDDLHDYMLSLEKIRQLITSDEFCSECDSVPISSIYPGHGPVIRSNALGKIDEYIRHRLQREHKLIECLSQLPEDQWISSLDLVPLVYGQLSSSVVLSAQGNLLHHLSKLLKENNVERKWPDLWRRKRNSSQRTSESK